MKKMLLATALASAYYGCAQQTFTVQNKPSSSSTKGNHHPSFLRFWELGRRKLSMQPKFQAAQKMLLKQNPANIRKWIARLYYFRHLYSPLEARVYCSQYCMTSPIWATLSALLINILLVPSSCFCIVISLSEGEIIPFSGVCWSGRLHYPRRRRWWLHALTDRLL